MRKIITVIGARPQFVKAATLSRQFSKMGVEEMLLHTGQHFDENMSQVFFDEMEIPRPAFNLDIHGMAHGAMTGKMLEGVEQILISERPEGVLVYGDTNSTLAGALAAVKLHIPVIHVEAGLRSFNMQMPEEINRILTDRIASLLLCPTETARQNLKREGFDHFQCTIIKNGDVMQDAAMYYAEAAERHSQILRRFMLKDFVLATIHRQENTDDPGILKTLIAGLNKINKEVQVVLPVHPRTRNLLKMWDIKPDFLVIDPVGYFDMIKLLKYCKLVITDSGGVQKEAFFFGKFCITLREQTEWTELVEHGFNALVGTDTKLLDDFFKMFMNKNADFSIDFYGNGKAAEIAVEAILKI